MNRSPDYTSMITCIPQCKNKIKGSVQFNAARATISACQTLPVINTHCLEQTTQQHPSHLAFTLNTETRHPTSGNVPASEGAQNLLSVYGQESLFPRDCQKTISHQLQGATGGSSTRDTLTYHENRGYRSPGTAGQTPALHHRRPRISNAGLLLHIQRTPASTTPRPYL